MEDSEFRSICMDYEACVRAIRSWSESDHPKAESRVNEYKELCEELESEALQYHRQHVGPDAPNADRSDS